MSVVDTARLISRFTSILAEEADRNEMPLLAQLLRNAEAEANEHVPLVPPAFEDLEEFTVCRVQ
ncbi:hypothetical protein [Chthonobacter albigriseus]|uniref:hypothetical protein n=1 Tax=Chthonobacter albigriseus TaxID=1683161 RepID=UPI0015EF5DB0|nr:hypothetical protein [Chthonobacter albigriseus]